MSLSAAFMKLRFETTTPDLPPLPEHLSRCVFTHPTATRGKIQAVFEVPADGSKVFDYDNDAVYDMTPLWVGRDLSDPTVQAIGHAVATACLLKLVHTRYPLLVPAASKAIVYNLLSADTLSRISDHFRLIDKLYVPASVDRTVIIDTNPIIKSELFLAYLGALSVMETAPPLCTLLQDIFGALLEAEYEQLKSWSQKPIATSSASRAFTTQEAESGLESSNIDEAINYIGLLQELQAKPKGDDERVAIGNVGFYRLTASKYADGLSFRLVYSEPTSDGADHQRMWTVAMTLDDKIVSQATRSKKKDAKNIAAGLALSKLGLLQLRSSKRARLD